MNKKFFAALASATMAFTASGSIAVFADDFVEENTPTVEPDELLPVAKEVVWNQDNFGVLAVLDHNDLTGLPHGTTVEQGVKVKTADLAQVTNIDLGNLEGEVKGLEYFPKLQTFTDEDAAHFTNTTLDFSANTKLQKVSLERSTDLAEIKLPEADEDKNYNLGTLKLENTQLTSLDLSKQEGLTDLTVKNSKLSKLDLSTLTIKKVSVTENYNLEEVLLKNGKKDHETPLTTLDLSKNALQTVNLDYIKVETLNLSGNHIGALDLSKTIAPANSDLTGQSFYVSENAKNVNLKEAIPGLKATKVTKKTGVSYDEETGVLTLDGADGSYTYATGLKNVTNDLTVTLKVANPMHRLYNPNSGEHFYTANVEEKDALVKLGWHDEGYGWVAKETPADGDKDAYAVYRLYNPNAGDHHYTMDKNEVKTLVAYGWKDEGTGWYSAGVAGAKPTAGSTVAVYRQYNPYANAAGSHNYTTDKAENDYLVSLGWTPEGTAWLALQ